MLDNVLILSASAGAGHVRAAQALEHAFRNLNVARNVQHVDTLRYTTGVFRNLYSKAYIDMANKAPEVLGWLYDHFDKPWRNERRRLAFDKLNTVRFVKMLMKHRPDIVVCTHFLPSEIISYLRDERKVDFPQAVVVTDMDVHSMWLCRNVEHYFVALDETKEHLARLGIPAGTVSVTGIPIDPVFTIPKDKQAMRRKYGLAPDAFTILVSAGGFGVGPMEHLMEALLQMQRPVQVIAICGRNDDLRLRLEQQALRTSASPVRIHAIGYTTDMDEYMAASDMIVGKPGGLTTAEALARGLVFMIVNPIPGQEERNADHLLEQGAALRCNNLPVLAWKIERLIDDEKRWKTMQDNVRRLAKPDAATQIVRMLSSHSPSVPTEAYDRNTKYTAPRRQKPAHR